MPDWIDGFEHESITEENRESFNTGMSKYATPNDAIVGGFNAQKLAGKPFRLPESLDKLPDDASRGEFTSQTHKLLGIEHAENIEALGDIDLKAGMAEGSEVQPDEKLTTMIKTLAIEKKWPKSVVQDIITLYNGPLTEYAKEISAAKDTKANDDKVATAKAVNEALIAHSDVGSEEKLKEQSELMRRAIKNKAGLTADEYEEVGDAMVEAGLTTNAVMARALLKLIAPLAAEGTTESGGGAGEGGGGEGQKQTPHQWKKERWPKSPSEWGQESDTWDGQSVQLRKLAGFK
jgi:hypothetical protein